MRLAVVVLCVLALIGCTSDSPSAPASPLNVQVALGVGESADIRGTSLRLRFVGVKGDSRCPADAICIQAGDAIAQITVTSGGGGEATYDLHTGTTQPVRHGDLTIALVELSPYPFRSRTIPPAEYIGTFRVTR